jgi:hypothetical protein
MGLNPKSGVSIIFSALCWKDIDALNPPCKEYTKLVWVRSEAATNKSSYNTHVKGRAIAHAVSRWLPNAAVRLRARVWSCGICGRQSGAGAGFLRVLRFPLPIFSPPISPQSPSSIIWGLAAVPSGLSLTHGKNKSQVHRSTVPRWAGGWGLAEVCLPILLATRGRNTPNYKQDLMRTHVTNHLVLDSNHICWKVLCWHVTR